MFHSFSQDNKTYFFLSSVSSSFKCLWVSKRYWIRKARHIKYQRRWTLSPCWGSYTRSMKNGCLADCITCSHCSLRGLLKRFILNSSILKVTAWFHIHNHSCTNVQFHFSPLTNHLLRPTTLTLFSLHWLICLLSLRSSFISNLKANISSLNITLLPYILSLSLSNITSLSLALLLSYPGIIRQRNEGIMGAPSR